MKLDYRSPRGPEPDDEHEPPQWWIFWTLLTLTGALWFLGAWVSW